MNTQISKATMQAATHHGDIISQESFRIIRERLGDFTASEEMMELVIRVAHTTGDVEFGKTIQCSAGAIEKGIQALRSGRPIITDVEMVKSGIRMRNLSTFACKCYCLLDEEATTILAAEKGLTRSAAAMRRAATILDGAVVAIGNAPTALFELMRLVDEEGVSPALVVGVPVGFVGALESKIKLSQTKIAHITNLSERGGSPIAAAIVNGLITLATKTEHD